MKIPTFAGTVLTTFAVATFLSSCKSESTEITVRELPEEERELKLVETTAERFRYQTRTSSAGAGANSSGPKLVHDTPEGWKVAAGSMMRDINMTFGDNDEGQCYLTRLPGAGGGLVPNVNRWRKQMGAPELSEEEILALPKKPLFGQPATFVKVDGTFTGMGSEAQENQRLLGLIISTSSGAVFVKMTGPKDLVATNEAAFDQFTSSLDVEMK